MQPYFKMKKLIFISLIFFLFASCEREPRKIELGNLDCFAFYLGDSWELNASVFVKNFEYKEVEDIYSYKFSYSVSIVTPKADTLKNVDYDLIEKKSEEEPVEQEIEIQININDNFEAGKYILIFDAVDNYTQQKARVESLFTLSDE